MNKRRKNTELNKKARSWDRDRVLDICSKREKGQKRRPCCKA